MSVASPSPLCGRWDCVPYVSECAHISVQVYYCRTSHFEQSCEPTDFCKAETISSQRTTELTRRRQKTESGGFNNGLERDCVLGEVAVWNSQPQGSIARGRVGRGE